MTSHRSYMSHFTLRIGLACLIAALTASSVHAKSSDSGTAPKGSSKPGTETKTEKVLLEGVRLITPEKEIEANVATPDFTNFVSKVDTAVQYLMYGSPQSTTLILQFECRPDGKLVQVIFQGKPTEKFQSLVGQLKDAVDAIDNMKVRSGKIEFSMQYRIIS